MDDSNNNVTVTCVKGGWDKRNWKGTV